MTNLVLGGGGGEAAAYTIDQSLRFDDGDSAKLTRTPGSAGNRKTFTLSFWFKLGNIPEPAGQYTIFKAGTSGTNSLDSLFLVKIASEGIRVSSNNDVALLTAADYRDPAAWYHVVIKCDTTESVAADRLTFYVNGDEITAFTTDGRSSYVTENLDTAVNNTVLTEIGGAASETQFWDGYFAEFYLIDGTAYAASDFGETDEDTNQWKPKDASGLTFGTNGFYLKFQDSAALGDDSSGNTNDFTVTNLVATDQMKDSPTNNFATFNPLVAGGFGNPTYKEGNLETSGTNSEYASAAATFAVSDGKWYWELYAQNVYIGGSTNSKVGIQSVAAMSDLGQYPQDVTGTLFYNGWDGKIYIDSVATTYGATYTNGDVIGIALDLDSGTQTIEFYKNDSSQGSVDLSGGVLGTTVVPMLINLYSAAIELFNFGQDSSFAGNLTAGGNADGNGVGDFYYAVPANHFALCTSNLSAPSITLPGDNFNTVLYTGDDGTDRAVTSVGFQPDLLWIKSRSTTASATLMDVARGVGSSVHSSSTSPANVYPSAWNTSWGWLDSFDSDGFTVSTGTQASGNFNSNAVNYAGWNWLGGGSAVDNDDGTIDDALVSANTTAGFSVVKYTGNDTSGATVGHGLAQVPELILVKDIDATREWAVYSSELTSNNYYLVLNTTAAQDTDTGRWNDTTATASVFSLGNSPVVNTSSDYVAYCFHSVEGYSKIGSYEGNGDAVGTFIYTGFRPAFVITKSIDSTSDWQMFDDKRVGYNVDNYELEANDTATEDTSTEFIDIVSNGFKNRIATDPNVAETYLYMAFAESPFKYANAR